MLVRNNLVFLELDRPTPSSGNTYPKSEVQKALPTYLQLISQGRAFGGFVDDINKKTSIIDPLKMSHQITELKIIGDNLVGGIATFNTPKGKHLETLIDRDDLLFDTRGFGKVRNQIISDWSIISIDIWFDPSGRKRTQLYDPIADYDRAMGIIKR